MIKLKKKTLALKKKKNEKNSGEPFNITNKRSLTTPTSIFIEYNLFRLRVERIYKHYL